MRGVTPGALIIAGEKAGRHNSAFNLTAGQGTSILSGKK